MRVPAVLAAVALAMVSCGEDRSAVGDRTLIHTVRRGDLVIRVQERAEVQASRDTRVTSQLEGHATLIHLIPEGTVVKAGDKIAELDASAIEEKRAGQAILVAKVEAVLEQGRKGLEILEKELLAAERTAESRLQIAGMRVEKFLGEARSQPASEHAGGTNRELIGKLAALLDDQGSRDEAIGKRYSGLVERVVTLLRTDGNLDLAMGEMANQILLQIDEISLADADLEIAKDTLGHSRRLLAKGFITKNELDRDEINHKRQQSKVTVAWNNLQLLIKYTLPETRITLEQEVENAQLGLASVRGTNDARRVREAAELKSSEAEFGLARERLDNWNTQIANAVVKAPSSGLVVYGRYDWDEPVYEGMEVRERQELIILPDVRTMVAEIKVHEAQIDKVAPDQRATVKVDAFPERTFTGRVSMVSSLPDPNPRNRDLKVFRVTVLLDQDNSDGTLRPGMNATVVINVGTLADVLQVPLPAIERRGDRYWIWQATAQGPQAVTVKLGGNNLTHVEVLEGLQGGERVYLVRPPGAQLPADEPESAEPGANEVGADGPSQPQGGGGSR